MATPNMNLTLPVVSTTKGPLWATEVNNSFTIIDQHNHTSNNGAPIPSAALDINADLPFNGYNATLLNSTQFIDQNGVIPSIVAGLYVSGSDLWFLDGASNPVQITSGGSIVGAGGTINGLPFLTASVTFYPGSGTYTFIKATDEAAPMDVGPVTVRRTSALSNGVTITPASGTTNWTLTLPASPVSGARLFGVNNGTMSNVAVDSTLTLSSSTLGVASLGIQTGNIANNAITAAKMGALTYAASTSTGNSYVITANTTPTPIPALYSVFNAITTRPMIVCLDNDQSGVGSSLVAAGPWSIYLEVIGPSGTKQVAYTSFAQTNTTQSLPIGAISGFYVPAVGVHTIQAYVLRPSSPGGITITNTRLVVYQL